MASTNFVSKVTGITAEWCNEVNTIVHDMFNGGSSVQAIIQIVEATPYTTYSSHTAVIPLDDTVPQNTEGDEIITVSITPKKTTNRLRITCTSDVVTSSAAAAVVALFQDSIADALAVTRNGYALYSNNTLIHEMEAGTTSSITFKIRLGPESSGTIYINGNNIARRFGGISAVRLRVEEIS